MKDFNQWLNESMGYGHSFPAHIGADRPQDKNMHPHIHKDMYNALDGEQQSDFVNDVNAAVPFIKQAFDHIGAEVEHNSESETFHELRESYEYKGRVLTAALGKLMKAYNYR